MAEPTEKPQIPTRKPRNKPTPAGKAGRMVAAGGAVGVSLALVGAMSAAAGHAASTTDSGTDADGVQASSESVRRVVVLPDDQLSSATQPNPQQIVIVLPDSITGQAGQVGQAGTWSGQSATQVVVTAPARPAVPAPAAKVAAPVTESSGS